MGEIKGCNKKIYIAELKMESRLGPEGDSRANDVKQNSEIERCKCHNGVVCLILLVSL